MKAIRKSLFTAALVVTSAAAAHAHAQLESANPRVGSTVSAAPSVLTLNFSEGVEPAFSTVQVTDAAGRRVDSGKPSVNGRQVQVPLRSLAPGQYNVRWRVLSVDTHKTEGSFGFEVRP
ncbi:MAG: copper resistance protein [Methylobacteriaceae bacterium]|jgi:methionine-rich copper-binding protein CopC|nr:copper resistance protein [Methylobacteriaceae bacterium]